MKNEFDEEDDDAFASRQREYSLGLCVHASYLTSPREQSHASDMNFGCWQGT